LIESEDLVSTPILVFANKQDLKDAMDVPELSETLALHTIKSHDWHIQSCCALKGEGLFEGLDWIHQKMQGGDPEVPQQ
jgi:ADP-ribosylation factor-like protein 5B